MSVLAALLAALAVVAAGCDDGGVDVVVVEHISREVMLGPAPGAAAEPPGGASVNLTISGRATYARYVSTPVGLAGYRVHDVCPFVTVQAVAPGPSNDLDNVLAETLTDDIGLYSLSFSTDTDYFIRVLADMQYGVRVTVSATTGMPVVQAGKGTSLPSPDNVTYASSSPMLHRADGNQTVNVHADLKLPYMRGGAFSILGTLLTCLRGVESAGGLGALSGALRVAWYPGNLGRQVRIQSSTLDFLATIQGTAFAYLGAGEDPYLLVLGGDADDFLNSDHDEFDDVVLAHEFGHFLMFTASRDQNWGGPHTGESLVPAAAYSEGLPTALGCALLGTRQYIDTVGLPPHGGIRVSYDCENPVFVPGVSGYDSEFSVTAVVWDILDGANGLASTDGDPAAVGLPAFMQSLLALANRAPPYDVIWLASLLQQLIDDGHLTLAQGDALMAAQGSAFPPPAGELWPTDLGLPATETGALDASTGPGGTPPNPILGGNANAVYRLELASAQDVTFTLEATPLAYFEGNHRLDLYIYDLESNLVFGMTGPAALKSAIVALRAGVYMVRVHHSAPAPQPVTFSLSAQ